MSAAGCPNDSALRTMLIFGDQRARKASEGGEWLLRRRVVIPPLKAKAESCLGVLHKFCTCHQGETEARLRFLPGKGDSGIRELIARPPGTPTTPPMVQMETRPLWP